MNAILGFLGHFAEVITFCAAEKEQSGEKRSCRAGSCPRIKDPETACQRLPQKLRKGLYLHNSATLLHMHFPHCLGKIHRSFGGMILSSVRVTGVTQVKIYLKKSPLLVVFSKCQLTYGLWVML